MLAKDIDDNRAIGRHGAQAITRNVGENKNIRLLTHCNTGSLATAGYGTALGVVRSLHGNSRLGTLSRNWHFLSLTYIYHIYLCYVFCLIV
jgi:methylthioribose-1-phosphate isomerase